MRPLTMVRVVLPAVIAIAGVVLLVVGGDAAQGAGIVLIGVALLTVLANAFMRLSLSSERDREAEEARRAAISPRDGGPRSRSRPRRAP
jgi:hypothetical protein